MSRSSTRTPAVRPLTKKDLDERIGRVAAELFRADLEDVAEGDWAPLPISTAEYVERMRRFMVYN